MTKQTSKESWEKGVGEIYWLKDGKFWKISDVLFEDMVKPFTIMRRKKKKPSWILRIGSMGDKTVSPNNFQELLVKIYNLYPRNNPRRSWEEDWKKLNPSWTEVQIQFIHQLLAKHSQERLLELIGENEESLYRLDKSGTWWLDGATSTRQATKKEVYYDPASVRNGFRQELRAKLKEKK